MNVVRSSSVQRSICPMYNYQIRFFCTHFSLHRLCTCMVLTISTVFGPCWYIHNILIFILYIILCIIRPVYTLEIHVRQVLWENDILLQRFDYKHKTYRVNLDLRYNTPLVLSLYVCVRVCVCALETPYIRTETDTSNRMFCEISILSISQFASQSEGILRNVRWERI